LDVTIARERLAVGIHELQQSLAEKQKRERYFRGEHDKPFAPQGVNEEYRTCRTRRSRTGSLLAVGSPVQRLRG
jgi:hypothetical protein